MKVNYDFVRPWRTLDPWQKEFLATKGNKVACSGRQVGKSTVVSVGVGRKAIAEKNKTIIIIAKVERQALLMFEKVLAYIHSEAKYMIKGKPTKHRLELKNGSVIHCVPTGESGYGIRGHTVDLLVADEASFINDAVWDAVTPMLAITKGELWLLSTPHGREGFFYRAYNDPKFKSFHVSSEDCPRRDDDFLKAERERMTKAAYRQEYLGEFVDELHRFFPDELIERTCILSRPEKRDRLYEHYLGVDVARMGNDESTFEIVKRVGDDLFHVENIVTTKTLTTTTTSTILDLNRKFDFKRIYIDDGGLGVAVFDNLLDKEETRRKVVAINNARRDLSYGDKPQKKKLMKEVLYNNLLRLMEQKKIKLLNDSDVKTSLRSIQFEYGDKGLRIHGSYSHIVEGIIRACWCVKDKHLKIYISMF